MISKLCNYNIADTLSATLEIIRNRYFVKLDGIIGDLIINDQEVRGIPWTAALDCLAMGNPLDKPAYPIRNTRVFDILNCKLSRFDETTLLPRIIMALIQNNCDEDNSGILLLHFINQLSTWFRCDLQKIKNIIDLLFAKGVITTYRGISPLYDNDRETISITVKGSFLWDELRTNRVLITCYRDEFLLDDFFKHRNIRSGELTITKLFEELVAICVKIWLTEKREIHRIIESGQFHEFQIVFGETMVVEQVMLGIRSGYKNFFKDKTYTKISEIESELKNLENEIEKQKTIWMQRAE